MAKSDDEAINACLWICEQQSRSVFALAVDKTSTIIESNKRASVLLGHTEADLVKGHVLVSQVVSPRGRVAVESLITKAIGGVATYHVGLQLLNREGQLIAVVVDFLPTVTSLSGTPCVGIREGRPLANLNALVERCVADACGHEIGWMTQESGSVVACSSAGVTALGYTTAEHVVGRSLTVKLMEPTSTQATVEDMLLQVVSQHLHVCGATVQMGRRDGSVLTLVVDVSLVQRWGGDSDLGVVMGVHPVKRAGTGDGALWIGKVNKPNVEGRLADVQKGEADAVATAMLRDERARRLQKLVAVFGVFDLDGSGKIESRELLQLGRMRRKLGQKGGEWSEAKNSRLVANMDANGDGEIDGTEFSEYFEQALPKDAQAFVKLVEQFMEVAQACREQKEKQHDARSKAAKKKGAATTTFVSPENQRRASAVENVLASSKQGALEALARQSEAATTVNAAMRAVEAAMASGDFSSTMMAQKALKAAEADHKEVSNAVSSFQQAEAAVEEAKQMLAEAPWRGMVVSKAEQLVMAAEADEHQALVVENALTAGDAKKREVIDAKQKEAETQREADDAKQREADDAENQREAGDAKQREADDAEKQREADDAKQREVNDAKQKEADDAEKQREADDAEKQREEDDAKQREADDAEHQREADDAKQREVIDAKQREAENQREADDAKQREADDAGKQREPGDAEKQREAADEEKQREAGNAEKKKDAGDVKKPREADDSMYYHMKFDIFSKKTREAEDAKKMEANDAKTGEVDGADSQRREEQRQQQAIHTEKRAQVISLKGNARAKLLVQREEVHQRQQQGLEAKKRQVQLQWKHRHTQLRRVYQEFDLDGNGEVSHSELLQLGQARRRLGQKGGVWTETLNDHMMHRIGMDSNGNLPMRNFVDFFDDTLTNDKPGFDKTMEQFMACATICRDGGLLRRGLMHMMKRALSGAWNTWRANAVQRKNEEALFRRGLMHMMKRALSGAWNTWRANAVRRKNEEALFRRGLMHMMKRALSGAWNTWRANAVRRKNGEAPNALRVKSPVGEAHRPTGTSLECSQPTDEDSRALAGHMQYRLGDYGGPDGQSWFYFP